jgi:lysophospholipase L1-like esterase
VTRPRSRIAALAALLLLVGCSTSEESTAVAPTTTRPRADAPVTTIPGAAPLAVVLGDSNTFFAGTEIRDALADVGFTPTVRGISGSGLKDDATDWLPAAAAVGSARPAVVIVALGTNDAVNPADVAAFPARLERLLAALGPVPVVWVTHTEGGGGRDPAEELVVNEAIRAAPARHPNVTVLDLAPSIAARPRLLGPDKLHYSELGRQWFAQQLADAATARVEPS